MMNAFLKTLSDSGLNIQRKSVSTLQINVGSLCNQACSHCHVEAGPLRKENMVAETFERLKALIERSSDIKTVDLTGGAPELNPGFRDFVRFCRLLNIEVIDRCNLTVLFEPGQQDLADFLADAQVHVIASLPCYSKDNVDQQRGGGVFDKSIRGLQLLNQKGFGHHSHLLLDLVYNPGGPFLPPDQMGLEQDYKRELKELFGIHFHHLYAITNMPIKRYVTYLKRLGKYDEYMELLKSSFNPKSAAAVMCTDLVSISWDGGIYDCDFNQMLELKVKSQRTIWDVETFDQFESEIVFKDHCYGCTAGAGSSCGGALIEERVMS